MLRSAIAALAAAVLSLAWLSAPSSAQAASPEWDCAKEFWQNDGDSGGSSGNVNIYLSGATDHEAIATFKAAGETVSLNNAWGSGARASAALYRTTTNGNIRVSRYLTANGGSSDFEDLSLGEGLKVFVELKMSDSTGQWATCRSSVFTS
ncbi:hypothetical protein AB0H88_37485 [Nonomuraea sp. NPDC050680]|uniref:hypothetical protein n=1 Tax=Nonomuraea sp. NPDC050680 TaxID=3154630 RepID=UPI0033FEBEF5